MITVKHIDQVAAATLRDGLKHWTGSINFYFDEFSKLYDLEIGDDVPVLLKFWGGQDDNVIYLHLGIRIYSVQGAEVMIT